MRKILCSTLVLAALLFAASLPAPAAPAEIPGLFSEGSARLTLLTGNASAYGQNYTVFGVGAGYFIADGLELGLDMDNWTGASPHIFRISPEVRYVFSPSPKISPYVGAFYRSVSVAGRTNENTEGLRAGAYLPLSPQSYCGAGVVWETALGCSGTCSDAYPELIIGFSF